ncbi:MAG: DUF3267 domain-containing protein [Prolixibacteraceae bacterium]|jgi:hypothetical protein
MPRKLSPEDLQNKDEFELLTEVSHQQLKEFVAEQITKEKFIIRVYSVYQILMIMLFIYLGTRSIVLLIKGHALQISGIGLAVLFSFTALIVLHELLHALAYWVTGARRISFGLELKKFIFYALADRQVIAPRAFHFVALAPFVVVKLVCLVGFFSSHNIVLTYFFLSVMCLHSLFCAGDIAMLAFYNLYPDREIYNYDNRTEGKTYFYIRKQEQNIH